MMREAAEVLKDQLVNVIVIPDGAEGDALLSKTVIEITDLDPKPSLGTGWTYKSGKFIAPAEPIMTLEEETEYVQAQRRARYQTETDGLYFEAMRGDGNLDAWTAAVNQIRADLPKPGAAK